MKKYKAEPLNYTDTVYLIEALTEQLGQKEGKIGTYKLELLCKLERNKHILYDQPEPEADVPTKNPSDLDACGRPITIVNNCYTAKTDVSRNAPIKHEVFEKIREAVKHNPEVL